VSDFNIRRIVKRLQLDRETDRDFLKTIPWLCTQCSRCEEICTEELGLPDLILALRKLALERGVAPETVGTVAATVRETGSPYQSLTRNKSSWQENASIAPDSEVLCWMGCTASIMSPNIAQATAKVLGEIGGGFRALADEPCCGEPLVALGLMEEAREVAAKAVEAIQTAAASGVRKLVTSCAGCYHTFTRSYPEKLGIEIADVEILHLSQFLGSIEENNLQLQSPLRVTYHDPCSLGRGSKVYDPPRQTLRSIGGLTLEEMDPTREKTLCCGGGGGIWSLDSRMAMEIASRNLAVSTGGRDLQAVVTTCPMCYNNFRYTLKKDKSPLRVYELSQIVAMSLG
jgi:Fe-S oxidoreductase